MDQRLIDLYDEYTHNPLPRRVFLERLVALAGGTAAAHAVLPLLESGQVHAALVSKNDPRIEEGYITYSTPTGDMRAYLAVPDSAGPFPAVVVIHENRGLNAHIEDVARRAAVAGFLAMAPDALSPLGGTPEDMDEARTMIGRLDRPQTIANFVAGIAFLKSHERSTGKVGCVGFCWGGAMANQLAVHSPDLAAAVAFYGGQADVQDVPRIKASLLLHYAELDARINDGIPPFEAALKANDIDYTIHMYEGVNHAFHNDTSEARYDAAAAALAWQRTIDFFNEKLRD